MPSMDTVVTGLGPVKGHVEPVAYEIAERWDLYFIWGAPGRGTGDHAKGLALDFMAYSLGGGVNSPGPIRHAVGQAIADYLVANYDRLNLTYVIWDRQIASPRSDPDWSWRPYDGDDPHIDHVHVSFKSSGTYQPPAPAKDDLDMDAVAELKKYIDAKTEYLREYMARRTTGRVSKENADRYGYRQLEYQAGALASDASVRSRMNQRALVSLTNMFGQGIADLAELISKPMSDEEREQLAADLVARIKATCVDIGHVEIDEPEEIKDEVVGD